MTCFLPLACPLGEGGSEDLKEETAQVEPAHGGSVEAAGGPTRRCGDARCDSSGPQTACSSQGGGGGRRRKKKFLMYLFLGSFF